MRRLGWYLALLVFFLALVFVPHAFAQTHPCDVTVPTLYRVHRATPVRAAFCHEPVDDEGTAIPLGQIAFTLLVDTVPVELGLLVPVGGPNAANLYFYESASMTFAQDATLSVRATYDEVTSLPSTPITLDIRGGPKVPRLLRVLVS